MRICCDYCGGDLEVGLGVGADYYVCPCPICIDHALRHNTTDPQRLIKIAQKEQQAEAQP